MRALAAHTVGVPYEQTLAAFRRGDNAEAARLAAIDVSEARASGDTASEVNAMCMLARVALREGAIAAVASRAKEAELIARASGDRRLRRMPLHLRAVAARMAERYDEGRELYLRSIELNEALDEPVMAAAEHRNLAYLELRAGDHDRARALFAESVTRLHPLQSPAMAPYLTFDQATLAAMDGDYETARERLSAAQRQWDEQHVVPDPDDAAEIARLQRALVEAF